MACPLNGKCKRALMLRAVSCDPSRKDLAALRDISLQLVDILVADLAFFAAEYADFLSSAESARFSSVSAFSVSLIRHLSSPFYLSPSDGKHVIFQLNGSSSSIPSGIFINPSPMKSFAGVSCRCAGACALAEGAL